MHKQYAMVIDSGKCIDCRACLVSCKVQNNIPTGFSRNWVKQAVPENALQANGEAHFQPGACMHCARPSCVQACPTGATYRDASTGEVRIDKGHCIGCGSCISACPYGARYLDPSRRKADKCDYCERRRAQGLEPACVGTCPTKARVFGNIGDPSSPAAKLLAANKKIQVQNEVTPTDPAMFYLNDTAPQNWPVKAEIPLYLPVMSVFSNVFKYVAGAALIGLAATGLREHLLPDAKKRLRNKHEEDGGHV